MKVVEVIFSKQKYADDTEKSLEIIDFLLHTLRMNGQVLGREYPVVSFKDGYRTYLLVPEEDALDESRANSYVLAAFSKLKESNIEYSWKVIGDEVYSSDVCNCEESSFYILYTTYLSLESPLRCGDCFGIIPLYRIPATKEDEYVDIITWESDYKACDTLQMNCSTGERFGITQLSKHDSSLSRRGIDICQRITEHTGIPTYYYLLKESGRSKKAELNRKCPSCNGDWLLQESMYGLFDFKCDKCRILSNIGWSIHK